LPQFDSDQKSLVDYEKRRYILEFWVLVILPWLLDLFSVRSVFTSVLGASLWGLAVAVATARVRSVDPKLRRPLTRSLIALVLFWLGFFVARFFESPQFESPESKALPSWLLYTHAGLLAAGAGMVILNLISSVVWLYQHSQLKRSSMERRVIKGTLPSLEALGKLVLGTADLALVCWGVGFFLAIVNAIMKWGSEGDRFRWFSDPKVLVSALLWLLLALQFQLSHFLGKGRRKLFVAHLLSSIVFLAFFIGVLVLGNVSALHEPLSWFGR